MVISITQPLIGLLYNEFDQKKKKNHFKRK